MSSLEKLENTALPTSISYLRLIADKARVTQAVYDHKYEGSGTDGDPYVVVWIDDDVGNPQNMKTSTKWLMSMIVAMSTLSTAFASSAFSGGIREFILQFEVSTEIITLGISLFVLGFALGPLLWAPLSELFGRQLVFFISFGGFTLFNVGVACSHNIESLLILRFFAGAFGSSPLTNSGGVIADIFSSSERGLAMGAFALAPFLGPTIGPIVGGFVGQSIGWRWIEGITAIFSGVLWLLVTFLVPETFSPVLLKARAVKLSTLTGRVYKSQAEITNGTLTPAKVFSTTLSRPLILLFTEPIVLFLSIYMAIIYGTLYMLFGAYPIVFQQGRGWSEGIGGLAFIGVAVGMIAAWFFLLPDNKLYAKQVARAPEGRVPPEQRLKIGMVGSIAIPLGIFWFAWTCGPNVHWASSVAAGAPFGFGMVLVFLAITNYLIDTYTIFAASVLAANSVLRSLFGFAFPLFTTYMYKNLGIHWASSVPAFLALVCVPMPFIFYRYGPAIRKRCNYAAESEAFMANVNVVNIPAESGDAAATTLERGRTATSGESTDTGSDDDVEAGRGLERVRTLPYEANPYDIDRINTTASGALSLTLTRSRTAKSLKTGKSEGA